MIFLSINMDWLKRKAEMSMGKLFIVFLLIVFALALTPTIGETVFVATGGGNLSLTNLTQASVDILELVPLVWVFIVVGIGAAAVVKLFEDLG